MPWGPRYVKSVFVHHFLLELLNNAWEVMFAGTLILCVYIGKCDSACIRISSVSAFRRFASSYSSSFDLTSPQSTWLCSGQCFVKLTKETLVVAIVALKLVERTLSNISSTVTLILSFESGGHMSIGVVIHRRSCSTRLSISSWSIGGNIRWMFLKFRLVSLLDPVPDSWPT